MWQEVGACGRGCVHLTRAMGIWQGEGWGHVAGAGDMWQGVRASGRVWGHVAGFGGMWQGWQGVGACDKACGYLAGGGVGTCGRGWGHVAEAGDIWQGVGACGRGGTFFIVPVSTTHWYGSRTTH